MKRGPKPRPATCHPERRHHGNGLCLPCYDLRRKHVTSHMPFMNALREFLGKSPLPNMRTE